VAYQIEAGLYADGQNVNGIKMVMLWHKLLLNMP
jgi:hypothetical protein